MKPIRTIYIDTEPYCKSQIESLLKMIDKNIKSSEIIYDNNWKFYISREIDKINKKIEMNGIIGILIIDYDFYKEKNIRLVKRRKFIQLVGEYCTKENFLNLIKDINRTVSYNGRSKPDSKGHIGFDYEILRSNFGVLLDDLPNVISEDLVITCHNDRKHSKSGLYGGQKKVEQLLDLTQRKSNIYDNKESLTNLLYQIMFYQLTEQNERTIKLRHKLMKLHLEYNKDDIRGMLGIDEKLNNIEYTYNDSSIIEKDDIKCKLFEEILDDSNDELKSCVICKNYYLQSDIKCPYCEPELDLLLTHEERIQTKRQYYEDIKNINYKFNKDKYIQIIEILKDAIINKDYSIIESIDIKEMVQQVKDSLLSQEEKEYILQYLDGFALDGDEHNLLTLDNEYNEGTEEELNELITALHNL